MQEFVTWRLFSKSEDLINLNLVIKYVLICCQDGVSDVKLQNKMQTGTIKNRAKHSESFVKTSHRREDINLKIHELEIEVSI